MDKNETGKVVTRLLIEAAGRGGYRMNWILPDTSCVLSGDCFSVKALILLGPLYINSSVKVVSEEGFFLLQFHQMTNYQGCYVAAVYNFHAKLMDRM